jgi:hypothetical protein
MFSARSLRTGAVEGHVREGLLGQGPVAERTDFAVEVGADPRDLTLGDPGVRAQGFDQVVDFAGGTPCRYASVTTANRA